MSSTVDTRYIVRDGASLYGNVNLDGKKHTISDADLLSVLGIDGSDYWRQFIRFFLDEYYEPVFTGGAVQPYMEFTQGLTRAEKISRFLELFTGSERPTVEIWNYVFYYEARGVSYMAMEVDFLRGSPMIRTDLGKVIGYNERISRVEPF